MLRKGIKRRFITFEEKLRVINEIEANPKISRTTIARKLGIPVTTLKSIYIKRAEIQQYAAEAGPSGFQRGRSQSGMYANLEKVLFAWLQQRRDDGAVITGTLFKEKALEVAKEMGIAEDFKASSGWVDKFRKRHGISGRSYRTDASDILDHRPPESTKNYTLSDIYQLGETELCYDTLLSNALEQQHSHRLAVVIGVNADGSDKLPLLVVGKDEDPRGSEWQSDIPVEYVCDPEEGGMSSLLRKQVEKLDERMRREGRNILLWTDRCWDAPPCLKNVKAKFFPVDCRSGARPLDLGVSAAVTTQYRKLLAQKEKAMTDVKHTPLQTLYLMAKAWQDVSPSVITHCFRMAGIIEIPKTPNQEQDFLPLQIDLNVEESYSDSESERTESDLPRGDPPIKIKEEVPDEIIESAGSPPPEVKHDVDAVRTIPTYQDAVQAYETVARYIGSKVLPPEDLTVMADFARILYHADAAPDRSADS